MTRKNFCLYPFAAFSIDNPGHTRICCNNNAWDRVYQNKKFSDPTFDLEKDYNNPLHTELRQYVIKDERHPSCQKCWDIEDSGAESYRQMFEKSFFAKKDPEYWISKCDDQGNISNIELVYLDITFGNKCNLKCVMCSGYNSSLFAKEQYDSRVINLTQYNKLRSIDWFEDADQFDSIEKYFPDVQRIHILGGEPLLIEHQEFLKKFIKAGTSKNVELSYNSNLTVLPREILDVWKEFKRVALCVSVDAYGPLNEFIRFPMKWSKLERNLEEVSNIPGNIRLELHATFGALNYISFTNFLEWAKAMAEKYPALEPVPFFNYIYEPSELDPVHLPENIKQIGYDRFAAWEANNKEFALNGRIQMLKGYYKSILDTQGDPKKWAMCLAQIAHFEQVRNTKFPGFN